MQLRELTRFLLSQINDRAPMGDILGFAENLARRFAAHDSDLQTIYYPAAAGALTAGEWAVLAEAAPRD